MILCHYVEWPWDLFILDATQVSSLTSVSVADVDLSVADSMRVFGITLDHRLTFDNHARSCNYQARAIRHIRHLLTQTLACSLILSRIDYCNSVLYSAPSSTIQKLQRVQNNAARIVLQALDGQTRCSRRCTGCLLNSASTRPINWPCWRSRLSRCHLRSIWASTSRCAPAHATLDRRPSHCCACHFDGHHLPDDRSALLHLWLQVAVSSNSLPPAVLNCDSLYFQIYWKYFVTVHFTVRKVRVLTSERKSLV